METTTQPNAITKFIAQNGLSQELADSLNEKFAPFYEQAEQWKAKAESLVVTDVSQHSEMKQAREARLALKDIRVSVEKKRKELKEDSLRMGKTIDGIANVLKGLIEPIEEHLDKQENYAAIQENNRLEALKEVRIKEINPYVTDITVYDLKNMPEQGYVQLLSGLKLAEAKRIEDAIKAEEERVAKEKQEQEERERIKAENERLKKESEANQKLLEDERKAKELELKDIRDKAEKERKEAQLKVDAERNVLEEKMRKDKIVQDAKLKKERDEKLKLENELRLQKEQKEKEEREKLEAEEKLKSGNDKQKLTALIENFRAITFPTLSSKKGKTILENMQMPILKIIHDNAKLIDKL